jgi:metal-responsive CopG/Arc/MetJ family transcriptional regulator
MAQDYEVITFKADRDLLAAMEGIPNRSAFIRHAILAALESTCPLCNGTGVLTPSQQQHWSEFAVNHRVEKCESCSETHLVCTVH